VQRLWQVLHLGKFRSSSSFEHGQAVKLTINADVRPRHTMSTGSTTEHPA
jgi:hypothetical protein